MRICTYEQAKQMKLGVIVNDYVADLNAVYEIVTGDNGSCWETMRDFIAQGSKTCFHIAKSVISYVEEHIDEISDLSERGLVFSVDEVALKAPIMNPGKIICLAANFHSHVQEGPKGKDQQAPEDLWVFIKPLTSLIGPNDPITVADTVDMLDYELERAIIIGKRGRYIPIDKALDHIGGYTVINDISDRKYMKTSHGIDWFCMKAQDNFSPIGPYILLADSNINPDNMNMSLWVNGELRQQGNTSDMVFKTSEIIHRLSKFVTLEPGDIIATGTPAGNGWSRKTFLQDGDILDAYVEEIGHLKNQIVFEKTVYRL